MKAVKKLFDVLNVALCIYGLLIVILHFFEYWEMPTDTLHMTVSILTVIFWMVQFALPKEINVFTSISFWIILNIWPFAKLWKLIPLIMIFLVLAVRKGNKIRELLNAIWDVCVVSLILAILTSGVFLFGKYLTNHILEEDTSYYFSEDGENTIQIYSSYIDGTKMYRYLISYNKGCSLDLGLREYKRFVNNFEFDLQYTEDKGSSFKWIDNDTFEFAGIQYDISK